MLTKEFKILGILMAVFFLSMVFLIQGVAPHISSGDAAELALAGTTLGVPHSPGYPVFSLINNVLGDFFFFGNDAYRQNLMSLFALSLALVAIGFLLYKKSGYIWSSFLPLILLFSPLFRKQALVTEVFPLAFLWAAILLLCLVVFYRWRKGFILFSFLFGLGVAVHQTLLLLLPGIVYFYFKIEIKKRKELLKDLPVALVFFIIGLSVHFFILFRSIADPILDWEDPDSLSRFWGLITRERYGFFQLAQGEANRKISFDSIVAAINFFKSQLVLNIGWLGISLLLVGTVACLSRKDYRRFTLTCWILIICTGPVFFWLANVEMLGRNTEVLNRFVLLTLIPTIIVISLGICQLWSSNIMSYRSFMGLVTLLFLVESFVRAPISLRAEPIQSFQSNIHNPMTSMRWDLALREIGLNTLRQIPSPAYLLSDRADEMEFALAYLKGAESRRPKIDFTDCNAGVTKSIYGNDYYRIWGKPRLARRQKVEQELIDSTDHPVFYATLDPLMVNIYRTHWGFLYRAWKLNQIEDVKAFPWEKVLSWRFQPNEERSQMVMKSLLGGLGQAFFEKGRISEAEQYFGLAQKFGGAPRQIQIGYLYQKRGIRRKAYSFYRKAYDSGVRTSALMSNLGVLEAYSGNQSFAIEILTEGARLWPDSIDIHYNLSTIHWRQNQWEEVVESLENVLRINPRHEEALRLITKAKSLQRFSQMRKKAEEEKVKEKPEKDESEVEVSSPTQKSPDENLNPEQPADESEMTEQSEQEEATGSE